MSFISSPSETGAVFAVVSQCGSAGGAMWDPPATTPQHIPSFKKCFLTTSPPVIIGDTYMSVQEGAKHINWALHTNGDQPCCPCKYSLP